LQIRASFPLAGLPGPFAPPSPRLEIDAINLQKNISGKMLQKIHRNPILTTHINFFSKKSSEIVRKSFEPKKPNVILRCSRISQNVTPTTLGPSPNAKHTSGNER
jgi:hypothetical protein